MRSRTKRIYGASASATSEAMPLIIAFVAGIAGSVAFKFLPVHPFVGAGWAIFILAAYAIYTYNATQLRLDTETIGDNCYYLGFLFTLTSLAVTLYFVIQAPVSQRADVIPEVISGFGVALASTIGGVFLRVLMLQLKVDMESRERRERQELNEASRRFRTELGMSLDQIKAFSVESLQQGAEREGRMREAFDKLLSEMQGELLKSAEEFGPALRESVRMQTQASLDMVTTAVHDSSDLAAKSIGEALSDMTEVTTKMLSQNTEAAGVVRKSVDQLMASTEALTAGASDTIERLSEIQHITTEITEAFARKMGEGTNGISDAMKDARERMETGIQSFSDATTRAGAALEQGADRINRSLDATSTRLEEAGARLVSAPPAAAEPPTLPDTNIDPKPVAGGGLWGRRR